MKCNCCGKKIIIENGIVKEDIFNVNKKWGYFSKKDGTRQEFVVCEECFDKWIQGFKVEVKTTQYSELV